MPNAEYRAVSAPLEIDDVIVLLLGAPGLEPRGRLEGITRLEKLTFLIERETPIRAWMSERGDFRSHRFGPFSEKVYRAADQLATAGLLSDSKAISESPDDGWEAGNVVIGSDADPYITRDFELTGLGHRYYDALLRELPAGAEATLVEFKQRFGVLPLRQLVRYVYQRYPEYTDRSEIKDDILR
ncbi:MAG: hypothetical protein JO168_07015 [Solirubrobacterales bacterium]|nr:hypothetical protein [Solirubrobacterales bacterium]